MREYQHLQLIMKNLNSTYQHVIMPSLQAAAIVLGSTSLYLNIAFGLQLPVLWLLICILSTLLCIFLESVPFSVAGKINTLSNSIRARLRRDYVVNKNRLLSRTLKSLREMKIMFGYSNFMEVGTCLVFLNFTANVTINLLLTFKI